MQSVNMYNLFSYTFVYFDLQNVKDFAKAFVWKRPETWKVFGQKPNLFFAFYVLAADTMKHPKV